jgi:hypothetical protein
MSHFTTIQTQIRDVEALEAACTELGVELLRNTEARGFANSTRHGELVVRLKGPYDIAANRSEGSAPTNSPPIGGTVTSRLKSVPTTADFSSSTASTRRSAKPTRNASVSPGTRRPTAPSGSALPPDPHPNPDT